MLHLVHTDNQKAKDKSEEHRAGYSYIAGLRDFFDCTIKYTSFYHTLVVISDQAITMSMH